LDRYPEWDSKICSFVDSLTENDPATKQPYSLRYIGAFVADLHRSLIEGGIHFYPQDKEERNGKLRLLYECTFVAFVVEQAGGRASTGEERILDITPESLHQGVPLAIGNRKDVALFEKYLTEGKL
jgi:fructose-1,6-bisphosphatase I